MEEEDDEFGTLYFDVLKPFSSFLETHNFIDQKSSLNSSIQTTGFTNDLENGNVDNVAFDVENEEVEFMVYSNVEKRDDNELYANGDLKNNDGVLVCGHDGCDSMVFDVEKGEKLEFLVGKRDLVDDHGIGLFGGEGRDNVDSLVFDVENEEKMDFLVEKRDDNEVCSNDDFKKNDGVQLSGGEGCDIDDNLVFDVENEQEEEEEMDSVGFNGENNYGVYLVEGDDDGRGDDLENEQNEEKEIDSTGFDVEKRDENESDMSGDFMDEQVDYGSDILETSDGVLLAGSEDGEIVDSLVFDGENMENGAEMDSTGINVERGDHNELRDIDDLMDEQIPGLYDSSLSGGLLENRNDLESTNNKRKCGDGEGFDDDCESEDGLNIILSENNGMEDELGNNPIALIDAQKMKKVVEDADGYGELGNNADNVSFMGARPVSVPEISFTDPRETQALPFRHDAYGHGTRLSYQLPFRKTVFDIDIDDIDNKPWRYPGTDISSFFNFGLDEKKWKDYCKQMVQLRLQISVQRKMDSSKRGKPKQVMRLAGSAIHKTFECSEQIASTEDDLPKLCDSDAIIEIVLLESLDDDLRVKDMKAKTVHKNINGGGILPFPLDGYCQHIPHAERGSKHMPKNDGQEGRQMIDLKAMALKRKDYYSYGDHFAYDYKKRMMDEFSQTGRVKYDERKQVHPNNIRCNTKSTCAVHFPEEERMRRWNPSDGNGCNFASYEDKTWRQGDNNNRQRLKQPAHMYDNEGATRVRNKDFGANTYACKMVHQNYVCGNNYIYKLSKGDQSDNDIETPRIQDPPYQEKTLSYNQNAPPPVGTKQGNDVLSFEQSHKALVVKESMNDRESDTSERDNELMMDIHDFVREINDLVDGRQRNHVEVEMIKVEEGDEKLKERSKRFMQEDCVIKTRVDYNKPLMPPLPYDNIVEETEIKKPRPVRTRKWGSS